MDTSAKLAAASQKKNFSKYDVSGTDPNRYASVSNPSEADDYLHKGAKSIVPGFRVNVGKTERILMIAAGSYLLYRALKKDHSKTKQVMESVTAGTMLFRGISGYCPAYELMDRTGAMKGKNLAIKVSLSVSSPVEKVYNAWRELPNLPLFMKHLESVMVIDKYKSEWTAKGPAGIGSFSWKAEILEDKPNELLSWHSLPDSTIHNAGRVAFRDNGAGTDIDVTISYHAPLGKAGEFAGKLFSPVFEKMIKSDIESFKTYIEA